MSMINGVPESYTGDYDEKYQLGAVVDIEEMHSEKLGISPDLAPKAAYSVVVADPYVERYSTDEIVEVRVAERQANDFAATRRMQGAWERRRDTAYLDENGNQQTRKKVWGDPVSTRKFFSELNSPAIDTWRKLIPSAKALTPLSEPFHYAESLDQADLPMDETGRKWLTLCTDAVAIRSRATVMAESVKQFSKDITVDPPANMPNNLRWMSIACGTALPAMKAALAAGINPEMLLVDYDQHALEATAKLAQEIGFNGELNQHIINIFDVNDMKKLSEFLGNNGGRPMLLDLMGIFEYTGDNLGVDPISFLRSNYDMLHPGGRLIFGQMRSDRPVPDFTMGTVGWPYVEMRSPNEFMDIIKKAGINPKDTTLFFPGDGVYTVGVIDKPTTE